ncbi:MAG TPA: molybdopterin cofactor-binding domain-containing protein [Thermoanaerobaculia bacterium]
MSGMPRLDRRRFFQLTGGGIAVFVGLGPSALLGQERRNAYPEDLNAYLLIGRDGRVTVFSGKIEMGQGVMTSQAQMVAEELGVALASIDMVLGDTDRCPWDGGTFGSLTTRMFGPALRAAAAEARAVLLGLASRKLGVERGGLTVADGVVSVAADPSRKVTYGELADGKRITRLVGEKAVLRSVRDFQVMGRSATRIDAPEKVTGAAKYAADIRLPGMLVARILRPPSHGATLGKLDTAAAEKRDGVTVVRRDDLVAALHAEPEAAQSALEAIHAEWQVPEATVDDETIFAHLVEAGGAPQVKESRGDLAIGRASAVRVFESTFRKGYVAHAPMEPHAAVADPRGGKLTVWVSTQTPFPTRDRIARALGRDAKDVRVITPFVGGGFGGKSADLQGIEAARLAVITGMPVQVAWTRAEEFFYDRFDPAAVVEIVSGIDGAGKIAFWDCTVHAAGERGANPTYDIANLRLRSSGRMTYGDSPGAPSLHPFAVGPWRAPGANMNAFAMESQIDLMAAAARVDPLEFRLRHTSDPRMRRVLQAAADAFGWKAASGPSGNGRGVACSVDAGSYDALMAEVRVDPADGTVRVERIVCAQDMGIVVNPDGAKMQMEGSIAMGLGYTFSEELHFRGGDILDRNFKTYHIPRFSRIPRIETVLVKNDELAPQGGGEPAIVATGAVIANAVFDATGVRALRLPLTPDRVREAIAKAKAATPHAGKLD